jgi:F-type H+-transporting ATPase subunit a
MILLAMENPLNAVVDKPWIIHGHAVTWMSSQIAAMIIVGVLLAVLLPMMARRRGLIPRGAYRLLELMLVFARKYVAEPAMGPLTDAWLPFVATLFYFLLGVNLFGLMPLTEVCPVIGLGHTPIGGAATSSLFVTGGLAMMTFSLVLLGSYLTSVKLLWKGQPRDDHHSHTIPAGGNLILAACNYLTRQTWPLPLAVVLGIPVWLNRFVPPISGFMGLALWPVLLFMELIGYTARCFALCIRLFANMLSGHVLIAVLLMLAAQGAGFALMYVSLPAALGILGIMILETLVAVLHAFIFTFLSALFIAMAANPQH